MKLKEIVALSVKHNVCYCMTIYTKNESTKDEQNHTTPLL